MATYNKEAVDQAIKTSRLPISKKEARLIHALLKGRKEKGARRKASAQGARQIKKLVHSVQSAIIKLLTRKETI
jgi:hypothetical protein